MVLCYLNAFNTCLLILLFIYINAVSLIASDKLNSYSLQVRPAKQYLNALRSHIFCCDFFFVAFIVTHVVAKLDNTFTTAITVPCASITKISTIYMAMEIKMDEYPSQKYFSGIF